MPEPRKLIIVDDHPLFREGLKAILAGQENIVVAAEAGTAAEALELARTYAPDIMTVDLSLPDTNGIQLIRELRQLLPDLTILVLSMHADNACIQEACKAGALGFIPKDAGSATILKGLRRMLRKTMFIAHPESVPPQTVPEGAGVPHTSDLQALEQLSPRELEVLKLFALGLTYKEVASQLFISPKTANNHRNNIVRKLQLKNSADLIRFAACHGLISPSDW